MDLKKKQSFLALLLALALLLSGFYRGAEAIYRCHLIAFQLAGENANEKNLITGTRYFNVEGMLPFEEMVGDYVRETGHLLL